MNVIPQTLNERNGLGPNYDMIGMLHMSDVVTVNLFDGTDVWVQIDQGKWAAVIYHGALRQGDVADVLNVDGGDAGG